MQVSPDFDLFRRAYEKGAAQVVLTRLVADLETPVSAALKLGRNGGHSFLLESVEGGAVRGRYSIIGIKPDLIWKVESARATINRHALKDPEGPFEAIAAPPLEALRALLEESRISLPEDAPPMAAGVFGYMGYDMVRLMEELPEPNPDVLGLPDGMLIRPTVMAIFDSVKDEVTVVTPVYPAANVGAKAAYARAIERISEIVEALDRPLDHEPKLNGDAPAIENPRSNTTPDEYKAMVLKAKDYIAAGDIVFVRGMNFAPEFEWPSRIRLFMVDPCRASCVYSLLSSCRCCPLSRPLRQFKNAPSRPGMATASCRAIASR